VQFLDRAVADKAIAEMDGQDIGGRKVSITFAQGDRKSSNEMRSKDRYDRHLIVQGMRSITC